MGQPHGTHMGFEWVYLHGQDGRKMAWVADGPTTWAPHGFAWVYVGEMDVKGHGMQMGQPHDTHMGFAWIYMADMADGTYYGHLQPYISNHKNVWTTISVVTAVVHAWARYG